MLWQHGNVVLAAGNEGTDLVIIGQKSVVCMCGKPEGIFKFDIQEKIDTNFNFISIASTSKKPTKSRESSDSRIQNSTISSLIDSPLSKSTNEKMRIISADNHAENISFTSF